MTIISIYNLKNTWIFLKKFIKALMTVIFSYAEIPYMINQTMINFIYFLDKLVPYAHMLLKPCVAFLLELSYHITF